MTKGMTVFLASLGYFLCFVWFMIASAKVAAGQTDWTVYLNYGTSVIWSVTGTIWMCNTRNF
ncbi:hypothetical protein HWB76_gp053 [Streptomyces phage Blueeyedbeauty]|uniref:Uncharacterized protein n=1 Tax=Streptomyces phage Blueeyedbeauty TaxID=2250336 RepID=A0A345L245_9CAUD|nr:hypothetical protein HWB76_gp053 [Streptomyces phage Blueeyedbeauty]AXH49347.1 hypothetical protein SEA_BLUEEYEDBEAUTY_240 [Streptomyces phage Blueeyedbeauty]